jgi:hypothetical protein
MLTPRARARRPGRPYACVRACPTIHPPPTHAHTYFTNTPWLVTVCSAGTGGTNCANCPKGTFSAGGNTTLATPPCAACEAGYTTDGDRATSRTACKREQQA